MPKQQLKQTCCVCIPLPALSGLDIIFKIRIAWDWPELCKRRSSQIRVQNHTGCIDYGPERWPEECPHSIFDSLLNGNFAHKAACAQRHPAFRKLRSHFIYDQLLGGEIEMLQVAQYLIDGRQRAK